MCGFCGFTGGTDYNKADTVLAMTDKLIHRGPDSAGTYLGDTVTLGLRRMFPDESEDEALLVYNEDKSLALVLDGKIYNHQELRDVLTQKGHIFTTGSDSETILNLYKEYGTGLLSYLRGVFAFALYDVNKDFLFCARDSFGTKPFYYAKVSDGSIIFGSEIKCFFPHPLFTPRLNTEALAAYLSFQYSVLPETFFKDVYKLPPGHYLTLDEGKINIERYFTPLFTPCGDMTLEKAVDMTDAAVMDSIAKHVEGCDDMGSFLSSGVDSSFMAACFGGKKTFTVGFDYEKYNEIAYARELSEKIGATHYTKMISTDEFWDSLPTIQYYMDEPLADPAAIAFYFACREASKQVKIALSGEGPDEFFGGYNIYREPLDLAVLTRLPRFIRKSLAFLASKIPFNFKGKNFFIRGGKTVEERFIGNAYIFTKAEREAILKEPDTAPSPMEITRPYYEQVKHEDDITKMQYLDINLWLTGDILLCSDKMSMAHSLEVRTPFLDREIFRAASLMPTRFRVNKKGGKFAFRAAAARHLPQETASRRKLGFPVPIRIWLRDEKYYSRVEKYFNNETAQKYFNIGALMSMLKAHKTGKQDNSRKIWTVYTFLLWYEQFFTGENSDAV